MADEKFGMGDFVSLIVIVAVCFFAGFGGMTILSGFMNSNQDDNTPQNSHEHKVIRTGDFVTIYNPDGTKVTFTKTGYTYSYPAGSTKSNSGGTLMLRTPSGGLTTVVSGVVSYQYLYEDSNTRYAYKISKITGEVSQ